MSIFDRTFHPDEANQAITTGRLLETGLYRYNPQDHHGPTLYYAAATIQKATGNNSTATLDPTLLRCTPLIFAVLALVFGTLAVRKLTGRIWHGLLFALILGTTPIFAFFATDFIQEMLFASFTMMMLWAGVGYWHSTRPPTTTNYQVPTKIKPGTWALLFGIAAGLAFATKETAILTFAAAGIAFLVWSLMFKVSSSIPLPQPSTINSKLQTPNSRPSHFILAFAGFILTATLLYSSFASNWQGVYNAFIAAPLSYIHRATGDAASQGAAAHVHPWWQYFKWLFAANWRFTAIPLLAAFAVTFRPRSFLHLYAIAILIIYSFIPYKTPWCALQIVLPLAIAPCVFFPICGGSIRSRVAAALIAIAIGYGATGIYVINRDPDSKDIPYNYASASPQVKELAALIIDKITSAQPLSTDPHPSPITHHPSTINQLPTTNSFVAVALPPEDTWPLPFYLRSIKDKVGYWTQFGELEALAGLGYKPGMIVVPAEEGHLVQPLFPHIKNTKRFEMRHRVRVRVFW